MSERVWGCLLVQAIQITLLDTKVLENNIVSKGPGFYGNTTVWPWIRYYDAEEPEPLGLNFLIDMTEWAKAINASLIGVKSLRMSGYFWQGETLMQLADLNFSIFFSIIMP